MPITGNASYIPTMDDFLAHWQQCNTALGASPLIIAKPGGPATNRATFDGVRTSLLASQSTVQDEINDQEIARGDINLKKAALLGWLNGFNEVMEAYYQGTKFFNAKPLAPGIGDGQERFTRPLVDAMSLWGKLDGATAPAGVTLPLTLADGTTQVSFVSAVAALQVSYREERSAGQDVDLAREDREKYQTDAYDLLKAYRLAVPPKLALHPSLVATLPRLTPEPGHTPAPVSASAVLVPPDTSHVVHAASTDGDLDHYELEGTAGEVWREEDAVHLGNHDPNQPNEFTVQFGLTQPGTAVTLKVFVVLKTGNRSGSAPLVVRRTV